MLHTSAIFVEEKNDTVLIFFKCIAFFYLVMLPNLGSAAHHSKANNGEPSVGRKKSLL